MGSLAGVATTTVLIEHDNRGSGATPEIYNLMGSRLVFVSETSDAARLNVNQVKLLTGGGRLTARPLYGHPVEFAPHHTIFLLTNNKPNLGSAFADYAIWQRLLIVPFQMSFVDDPQLPNERKKDPKLGNKLREEGGGILKWLVDGYQMYLQEGLNTPPSVKAATEKYRAEEDNLQQFIDLCCVCCPTATVRAQALFDAYKKWALNQELQPLSMKAFGERLSLLFTKTRDSGGNAYSGIGLLAASP